MSELNTPPLLLFDNEAEVEDVVDEEVEDEFVQYSKNNSRENLYTPDDSENYKNNLSVMLNFFFFLFFNVTIITIIIVVITITIIGVT